MKRRSTGFFFFLFYGYKRKSLARKLLARLWDYVEIPLFPQTKKKRFVCLSLLKQANRFFAQDAVGRL